MCMPYCRDLLLTWNHQSSRAVGAAWVDGVSKVAVVIIRKNNHEVTYRLEIWKRWE